MDRPFIEWVRIQNFRCVKHVDLHLTPLHALIGPNDSGKSSLLRALQWPLDTARFWLAGWGFSMTGGRLFASGAYPNWVHASVPGEVIAAFDRAFGSRRLLRLDPDALRKANNLISAGQPLWFGDEPGTGLAGLYDALLSRDRRAFIAIDEAFCRLFPTVRGIHLINATDRTKSLGVTLKTGVSVGPQEMSEGMLYWLAYAILQHVEPTGLLVIEEPENGLHPSRIAEVMRILREVSRTTQVVLATHSPLVINELQPEEVTIVTRTERDGTICTPMLETKDFQARSKTYALGELWLAFADGEVERGLVSRGNEGK